MWTQEEQDAAIQFVADAAREFSPEGYLNQHAVSQVAFELACQRNELLDALKGWQSLLGSSFLDMTHKEREVFNAGTRAIAKAEGK